MADKRRPGLRDELSASLQGLDDLAAELAAPADPDAHVEETAAFDEPDDTSLETLDPDYEKSLDEVRSLASLIAEPADEVGTRHLGIAADARTLDTIEADWVEEETPLPDLRAGAHAAEPVEAFAPEGAAEAAPAEAPVAEAVDEAAVATVPADEASVDEAAVDLDPVITEEIVPTEEWAEAVDAADDIYAADLGEAPPPLAVSEPADTDLSFAVVNTTTANADADSRSEATLEMAPAHDGGVARVTDAVMPAAVSAAPTTSARPWTPEAAMEPIAPLAPPPARPITPIPETEPSGLPADGGRKMNILPVVVLAVFAFLILLLFVIVIHQT